MYKPRKLKFKNGSTFVLGMRINIIEKGIALLNSNDENLNKVFVGSTTLKYGKESASYTPTELTQQCIKTRISNTTTRLSLRVCEFLVKNRMPMPNYLKKIIAFFLDRTLYINQFIHYNWYIYTRLFFFFSTFITI